MGASSSGLLDEAKITSIKGLVSTIFQNFSVFYHQQYSAAYFGHLYQEVEPKKEGRGLLLTQRLQHSPDEVLYQGCVKFSCWNEQGTKCRERYVVLRRDYKVEIHENMESFSRGCAAKLVLQTAGGRVFTTVEESRAHLEQTCAGVLNEVKEDSSSVASLPDAFAVYLHLPYMGHTCFLFQQGDERDHFLSVLKTCIRHSSLDPWCDPSYESQAFIQALHVYQQEKGCYESWEMLLGSEEKVLASQVMEEVLPWLQSQLQLRVKGKKTERMRQWLATMQATYALVLEQLTASLEALREECRHKASANQALIRSNLDQIMSSHCFLEEKVRACVHEEAEKVCSESVAPYMPSILEVLTEHISEGIQGMQRTLHTQMDSALTQTTGGKGGVEKALSTLHSISLDQSYQQVENLTEKLEGLKQRFGLSSTQRLVHSAHLEMEKLLDSAVYTLELFLQSSFRLQPSQVPDKMERAKGRVLKQLDYDSRVVQRRLYQEALLEITLPVLTRTMDGKWKTELQQFEQYIFSDYSTFILVHNVYDAVLINILSKEIETAVQDAASKKINNLLLDTSDLAISQYSLLGQTPPRSEPGSPATRTRGSCSTAPSEDPALVLGGTAVVSPQLNDTKSEPSSTLISEQSTVLPSPVIIVTQQYDESPTNEGCTFEETQEEVLLETEAQSSPAESSVTGTPDSGIGQEVGPPDAPAESVATNSLPDSPDNQVSPLSSPPSTDGPAECAQSDQSAMPENSATPELSTSEQLTENQTSVQHQSSSSAQPPRVDSPVNISLGLLCEAISCNSAVPPVTQVKAQSTTDRAVYLTGEIKENWEIEKVNEERQKQMHERVKEVEEETGEEEEEKAEHKIRDEPVDEGCQSAESPAGSAGKQGGSEEKGDDEEKGCEPENEKMKEDNREEEGGGDHAEREGEKEDEEQEIPPSRQPVELQPDCATELPMDSVAVIRELVTEIFEVETAITPCPGSSSSSQAP